MEKPRKTKECFKQGLVSSYPFVVSDKNEYGTEIVHPICEGRIKFGREMREKLRFRPARDGDANSCAASKEQQSDVALPSRQFGTGTGAASGPKVSKASAKAMRKISAEPSKAAPGITIGA